MLENFNAVDKPTAIDTKLLSADKEMMSLPIPANGIELIKTEVWKSYHMIQRTTTSSVSKSSQNSVRFGILLGITVN
jgi:hypothetical protein